MSEEKNEINKTNEVKDLAKIREEIDLVDRGIVELFCKRIDLALEVAESKRQTGKAVFDPEREKLLLKKVSDLAESEKEEYIRTLYSTILSLSHAVQHRALFYDNEISSEIKAALNTTPLIFPERAHVACQGVVGAYSQVAADRFFRNADISYFSSFSNVFEAIESGMCEYGVLPIENSTAGSVGAVYDLMLKHKFYIVRSCRIKVSHSLLANPGATLDDIKVIISHEQAINQCSDFLSSHPNIKVHVRKNTAMAAKEVRDSGRLDIAAIASESCEDIYGLSTIEEGIQNQDNNYTRFICIAKKPEVYPGANKTAIMAVLPHKEGSLYNLLSRFAAYGANLTKIESVPLPEREFEFMFYFDFECSVYSEKFYTLICELSKASKKFRYLGSYLEIV